ncbi:tetratricopeptide repeat-containing serine/threonine-protein kinase [Laspinema sp. D1]|uniref:protein kinase domain-containing protein n=1 Tax=Laspinema palackyanum TaxID=3231601 RepID=UPI00348A41B0|nr:tetratricopeptide repeat-containing serine/threonine-protein kinase [Laspinema sp. D2b]
MHNNNNAYYLNSLIGGQTPFRQTYLGDNQPEVLNPQYIIKKIVPHANPPRSFEEAKPLFQKEADLLYRLGEHPQIPEPLDKFDRNGVFYLIYQRIHGESLAHELKDRQPWNEARVIVLIQEILEILKFFHAVAGPHLDIHPTSFIRRRSDGKLVLIDFGAVRSHELSPIKLGTLLSDMPSDTARDTPGFHSDIYAVGSIAIHALTGVQPTKPQESNSNFRWRNLPQVSDSFAATLDKMVNPSFKNRYESVDEVLRDLKKNQRLSQLFYHLNPAQLSVALKFHPKFISLVGVVFLITLCTSIFREYYWEKSYKNYLAYIWLELGNELNQSQQYEKAILAAEESLKYRHDFAPVMLLKAYAIGQNNPQTTPERYRLCFEANQLKKNYAAAWNCLGNIAFQQGQVDIAIYHYDAVINLYKHPKSTWYNEPKEEIWAVLNKANVLIKQKEYSDAKTFLNEFKNEKIDIADEFLIHINNKIEKIDELMP